MKVPNLPREFHGFRIAQLTDLHFGPATSAAHIREAVDLTNSQSPHLITLTGDYIQNTRFGIDHRLATQVDPKRFGWMAYRREVRELATELSRLLDPLEAPHGIVGVFGNHDYLEGLGSIRRKLPRRIRWIVNSAELVRREGTALLVAGVDDFRRGKPDLVQTAESAAQLLKDRRPPVYRLLLSHNPDIATDPNEQLLTQFDLVLCGHTHGGQVRLPLLGAPITRTRQKLHTSLLSTRGTTQFYVNHGAGYGGLRLRLFCPPEVAVVVLEPG